MAKRLLVIYQNMIRPRLKHIVVGLLAFFALFTIVGFLVLPPVLKSILVKELSKNLHREVSINQIRINPYTLSMAVRGLVIKDRADSQKFLSCDEIFLNLQSISTLRLALVFKQVRLTNPYLRITRKQDLSYNFSDLLETKPSVSPKKAESKPLKFSLNNIIIENGSIDFVDGPMQTKHTVRGMRIGVPFLSNIPSYVQIYVQPHFSAKINDSFYSIQGKTKPFADSHESSFDVNIKDLDITGYLPYFPIKMGFRLVSACMDTQAKVSFVETKHKKPLLTVSGNVSLKQIAMDDEKNQRFFSLPLLSVSIAGSEPLSKIINLSKVTIESPQLEIKRDEKGVLNLQSLLPEEPTPAPMAKNTAPVEKKKEDSLPLSVNIDEIQLTGGKVSFSDLSTSRPFKTILDQIALKIDGFSNGKDKKSAYALSFNTEARESAKVEGEFYMNPLKSEGLLDVKSVPLKKYSPFYMDRILFGIEDGRLDLSTRYKYAQGDKAPEVNLSEISIVLNALRLKKPDESDDFVKIPTFSIKETDLSLANRELKIGNLSTQKGEIFVKRSRNGDVNLLGLIAKPASTVSEPSKGPDTGASPVQPEKPWSISLKQVLLDDYTIRVADQTNRTPVTITAQSLKIRGENFSTAKNSKGKLILSLILNERGTLSAAGDIGIEPLLANLTTELKGIEIAPFQPYFAKRVKATVTGGALSTRGNLSFSSDEKRDIKANFKGEVSLANFSSIDKLSGQDLLKFESLSMSGVDFGYDPFMVGIKGVALTDFYAFVRVNPDGKINLQEVLAGDASEANALPPPVPMEAAGPPEQKKPSKNIRIDEVTLQAGKLDFLDKSVKPEFSTSLSEMGGRVSGLSSEENTTADVELLAKLNDYAPLEITGKINPLRDDLFVDLKARIKDLDLSPATPYAGKYVGYTIEKGKLSFDLQYLIVKRKLESQNNIRIDQFTFGDKVESPQATRLPVRLAVALLKDRNGQIKLDLPVTGSLDDPKFSVWKIVLQIFLNLITKAATSPFALLGALFGGGEELSYVEFEYGSTNVTEPNLKKLDTVCKALQNRPSLKMDIEGHVDMEKDKDGLRQILFSRKVKVLKLNDMVKKAQPAVPVDDVKIEPVEYEKYLKTAYRREKFPKPTNFLGMAKDIPVPEMEKLMLTHVVVTEGDLRTLASQRAMKVRDVILKSGQVEPERVFILEPKSLAGEKKDKAKDSRVDFKLE